MTTSSPTYWMLDALTGWRTLARDGIDVNATLTLQASGSGARRYRSSGTWCSSALDGALPGCQWHRIECRLAALPAGTALALATFAADDHSTPVQQLPEDAWSVAPPLVGAVPRPNETAAREEEFLVQSPPGRYLWVRLELTGDGHGTPDVGQLVVHYPRNSYLRYLPAVFSSSDAGRSFLERFLSIPQTEWDDLRERIATIARYFDPRAVPDGPALEYLGGWIDAQFEPDWTDADRRRLLCVLPRLRGKRGTARAVRAIGRVYLRSIAGSAVDRFQYPYLIEGFRERDWLSLPLAEPPPSSSTRPRRARLEARLSERRLWSAGVVRRLQVGGTAQAGYSKLVSIGSPESDMFAVFAHRVRALVPAGWVRTAGEQRLLERGLRVELPAHVRADLTLLEPHVQPGAQATLGVDTVAGPMPTMRLGSAVSPSTLGAHAPAPSRPPRSRLGYDTVLARAPREPLHLTKGDRS